MKSENSENRKMKNTSRTPDLPESNDAPKTKKRKQKPLKTAEGHRKEMSARRNPEGVKQHTGSGNRKHSGKKRGSKKRTRKKGINRILRSPLLTLLLLCMLFGISALTVNRIKTAKRFSAVKNVVCDDRFYEGTVVETIDISGMTLDEALNYWKDKIESKYADAVVSLDNGQQWTTPELGYSSDYADVLNNVWTGEHKGSIDERYEAILNHDAMQQDHSVHRVFYNDETVREQVDKIAETIDTPAQDAKLLSFNDTTYEFEYQDSVEGKQLNREKLVNDIEAALSSGGGAVTMEIDALEPAITKENVSSNYGLIAYAITNASSSTSNRLSNIKLALSIINGTAVEPGETFSFNQTVGERTKAAGFKKAPAYYSGEVVEEIGGGICQVSTTVFNAAVKADLEIKERHEHSMVVSYVDPGKDAAVDWGNKDLKFTNTSDETVYICCYLTEDERVRVGVFGKLLPNGQSIVLETKKTGDIDYKTEYRLSFELPSGATKVAQAGKKGVKATTYKVRLDAQGNEIAKEELFRSSYNPKTEIIEYGQ